jgi:hypothetical protein
MSAPNSHRRSPLRGALLGLIPLLGLLASSGRVIAQPTPAPAVDTKPAAAAAPSPLRMVVNIPAFRLEVYERDALLATYPVTVGKPAEPTPPGRFEVQRVVWNPWWHPLKKRKASDRVTPPGPRNPMGKVKLYFASYYYLHGTPKEKEIGTPASLGCVRLRNEDAIALAQLVHRHAIAPLPPGKLEELASTRLWRTQGYKLQTPIPLHIAYELAEVRDGLLTVHGDIYRLAALPLPELAARALEAAGYARQQIDLTSLARTVGLAPGGFRVPVADLLMTSEAAAMAAAGGAPSSASN